MVLKRNHALFWVSLIFFLQFFTISGCCGPQTNFDYGAETALAGAYRIGAGDILVISIEGVAQQSVTVHDDGHISFQRYGNILVGGLTALEVQENLSETIQGTIEGNPEVTVRVEEANNYRVYVVGRVHQPGEYSPENTVTILQALALAQGLTELADSDRILIVRRDPNGVRRIPFVYRAAVRCGRVEMDIPLIDGDTVVVP